MKGYSKYFKWVVAFVLALIPALVLAADPNNPIDATSMDLFSVIKNLTFTPPDGDMSVGFLGKLFGVVPGVPQLARAQSNIVGLIFGIYNGGITAFAGVFLGYTVFKIITTITVDGSPMGKSMTAWTAVRCSMGIALLTPTQYGYSTINSIVIWVVVQSVGLADQVWNTAMDYLKGSGVAISVSASVPYIDYSLINPDIDTGKTTIDQTNHQINAGSADVMRSLACSETVLSALRNRQKQVINFVNSASPTLKNSTLYQNALIAAQSIVPEQGTDFSVYKEIPSKCTTSSTTGNTTCQDGYFIFPYINKETTGDFLRKYGLLFPGNIADANKFPKNLTGICGAIGYLITKGSNETAVKYTARVNRYIQAKRNGLQQMIDSLIAPARNLVSQIQLDDKGVRKIDPFKFVVYNDENGDHYFLKDLSKTSDISLKNQTASNLMKIIDDGNTLPGINWPLGATDILASALMYQSALAGAQNAGYASIIGAQQDIFAQAKQQGWITAGNYYRLLASALGNAELEYDSYRSTGYDGKEPYDSSDESTVRTNRYGILFNKVFALNPTVNTTSINYIWGAAGDKELLSKVLIWISMAYPYAKLYGGSNVPKIAETAISPNKGISAELSKSLKFSSLSKGGIIALTATGAFLLAIPVTAPFAIPILIWVPMAWLNYDIKNIIDKWNDLMADPTNSSMDPILKLQSLGIQMLTSATDYISQIQAFFGTIAGAISTSGLIQVLLSWAFSPGGYWGITAGYSSAVNTTSSFLNSLAEMTQTIVLMQLPLALAVIGPIFVSGIIFSIYVPLIPYLLFLFGALSWLISVLVLMASAPIICFLILWGNASQDNPLLSRETEQFIMQLIAVFFRPTLMVIGLITGMVLSYIGVDLLNLGFSNLYSLIVTADSTGNIRLIQSAGVIVVYTFIMVSLVNLCFSPIHLLYSEAMRIANITAPGAGMEEKYMEGVKGGVQQFGEAGAAGAKESGTSLKGAGAKGSFQAGEPSLEGSKSGASQGKTAGQESKRGITNAMGSSMHKRDGG